MVCSTSSSLEVVNAIASHSHLSSLGLELEMVNCRSKYVSECPERFNISSVVVVVNMLY